LAGGAAADIAAWLQDLGLERYAQAFRDHDIDAEVLRDLTEADLEKLAIPLGHRKKLLRAIARLTEHTDPSRSYPTPRALKAERRQLTVMFVDLVGSTELAGRLDPEDMAQVIGAYQECCAEVIERWEGHVANYIGDGVLAYFGWPRAHEDEAERAIKAGLELTGGVAKLDTLASAPLAARVGIATGLVMVGELFGEGTAQVQTVFGETPNLAARLQTLAAPGTVVISQATRKLIGRLFELDDLGLVRLKGFAEPLAVWRVTGESRAEGRFEARHTPGLTPLVGRGEEIALLLHRWRQARDGEGQVVLLSGEPGIGKSRLVRELRARLEDEPHIYMSCQCSPYHQTSPLHPVIEHLERAAGFARDDAPDVKLAKLEALLARGTARLDDAVPLIGVVLRVPFGERYALPEMTPQRQRQRTLEVLVDQLEGLAAAQPVLLTYEDVHWIDPTTQELLGLTVECSQRLPVLSIITFRREFHPPWTGLPHVRTLTLTRLGRRDGAAMVERVAGTRTLPAEVRAQIVAKTDGVPLFVEELTKMVLESGLLTDAGDRYELSGPLPPLAIPATLRDSLMARLDRLAPVKEVAQTAAVIGREFGHGLLAAVAGRPEAELEAALDQLVAAELLYRRGVPPNATYDFKHALVQDTAYGTLLKSKRQQLHARIAQVLEERFPGTAETQPELLAHHCTEAGLVEKAIRYWLRAGQLALARSGTSEAMAHLWTGLDLLGRLPEGAARRSLELDLQLALAGALAAVRGHGVVETEQAYDRAVTLSRELNRPEALYPALDGAMTCRFSRAELKVALRLGHEFLSLTRADGHIASQIVAHMDLGIVRLARGELQDAKQDFESAIVLYDPHQHMWLRVAYSYDPEVICSGYLAWVHLALGQSERARDRSMQSVARAQKLAHPLSLGFALARSAAVYQLRREIVAVEESAKALRPLALSHGFGTYVAVSQLYQGWALAQRGRLDEGVELLKEALASFRASRDEDFFPHSLSLVAEALARRGEIEHASALIAEALDRTSANEERWFEAELHRLKGEALLARSLERSGEAEACYCEALAVARNQRAHLWELRAATSLARLWRDQGRRAEAYELLAPVYGWFTEGFDTADLEEAKALLDELR
jgi:class 3 adenylate cyclase/predicted ATPase